MLREGIRSGELRFAHQALWAYAEANGLDQLLSEDFQDDRTYGTVRVVNPFVAD